MKVAMHLDVRDQRISPKETAMSQNDKKDNQNPSIKDPSSNQSSNPSNPNAKPGMKEDEHKTGTGKSDMKNDDHKTASDKSGTNTSGDSKR